MGIFNSGSSTAQLTPVIFSGKGASSSSSEGTSDMYRLMQMNQKREAVEDKNVSSFETEMGKVSGLEGDVKYVQRALIDNEMNRRILRQQANSLIMSPNVTDTQLNGILEKYQQGRMSLERQRYDILMNKDQMKTNLEFYTKDVQDNKNQYSSPVLNMDFGGTVVSTDSQVAGEELFLNTNHGVVLANNGGRYVTKSEYLNKRPDMTLIEEDGSVAKYMPMVESMTDEKYIASVRGRLTEAASKMSGGTSIIGDVNDIMRGGGSEEVTSKSNRGALVSTMKNIYSMMSTTEKNRAAERALVSGMRGKVVIAPSKGDKGYTFEGSLTSISEEMRKQKAVFNDTKKSDAERQIAGRNGIALAAKFVQGVQSQATLDAFNLSAKMKGLLEETYDRKINRPSDKYLDAIAVDAAFALLNPENVQALPTSSKGTTVWEDGILKEFKSGGSAYTQSLKGQLQYLQGNGIDLTDEKYDKNKKGIFDLTNTLLFNSTVYDKNKMTVKDREAMSKWKIIGLDTHVRVMPDIQNGRISRTSGNTTYIGVRVVIDKPSDLSVGVPTRQEKDGKVRYSMGKESATVRNMTKAGLLQGVQYNEVTNQYEAVVMVPIHSEGMYDSKASIRNTKMMMSDLDVNSASQKQGAYNLFKQEDIVSEKNNDSNEWQIPSEGLPETEEGLARYLKQKALDDAERKNYSFGSRVSYL